MFVLVPQQSIWNFTLICELYKTLMELLPSLSVNWERLSDGKLQANSPFAGPSRAFLVTSAALLSTVLRFMALLWEATKTHS